MTQYISPGVYTEERDLSQYVSDLSKTIVAMVGTAEKGPSNQATLITSPQQFVEIFGAQNPKHYLGYAVIAYLKQGNTVYVTRVAAPDAAIAKLTIPLPKTATPFAGKWTLVANTSSEATFLVEDFDGIAKQKKVIKLDSDTSLPGFDFTDTTGQAVSNGKIGSDLASFIANPELAKKYVIGSTLTIASGAGKDASVFVTGLSAGTNGEVLLKVAASKFNSFNSPITATAVGTLAFQGAIPAPGTVLATIAKTNYKKVNEGSINLVYDTAGTAYNDDTKKKALADVLSGTDNVAKLSALDQLISVVKTGDVYNASITVPLHSVPAVSLVLLNGLLTSLINVFRTMSLDQLTAYTNVQSAFTNLRAQASSGIIGLGSVALDGSSSGVKASELVLDAALVPTKLRLFAITPGAAGVATAISTHSSVVATPMAITGTFALDVYRPSWDLSLAGDDYVATYLKFTSIGEGDFSNKAVTLSFDPTNLDRGEQVYVVRVYTRNPVDTVDPTSKVSSDFTLSEQFEGTVEVLRSRINGASRVIRVKIDYNTHDVASLITGGVVYGLPTDNLVIDPVLNTDITGKGLCVGTGLTNLGAASIPTFEFYLQGGSAGSEITKSDIIGDIASKTGIYNYSDPEQLDLNLLVVPGWSADPAVAKAMVALCEKRSDCMSILDTPFALNIQGVINYRKNILNINSNYGALYYPWVKVTDTVNKKDVFVPPSGLVSGQYAYNDLVGEVYTAPAGRQRGNLTEALFTERILNQGDRDMLALYQINPIHFESGWGTYIRGQMTLQTATTALDRVNVRRLLLKLRKVIATASKYFEFEPGDIVTATKLKMLAESVLEDHLKKGAIKSYTVDVGPNVNTVMAQENNELRMSISLVPVKTAEKIIETFNILGQGQGISIS